MSANRPALAILFAALGAALALALVRLAGFESAIDRALPFWVGLAALAGAVAISEAAAQRIGLAVPVLLGAAIAIPADAARHVAYGLVLAAALAAALIDAMRDGEVPRGRAIALALLVVATRAFPFEGLPVVPFLLVAIGTVAMIVAQASGGAAVPSPVAEASRRRPPAGENVRTPAISLLAFLLVVALALVTPLAPWDAALVPLAFALALFSAPARGFSYARATTALGALLIALVVGRWMAAAVAVVLAARFAAARRKETEAGGARAFAFPLVASRAGGAIAAVAFAPGAIVDGVREGGGTARSARRYDALAAALLFVLSLFARPQPALLLGLMALLVLAPVGRRRDGARDGRALAAVPGALLFGTVALTAWSGAAAASFPIFADREAWIPFAIACAAGLLLVPDETRAERPRHAARAIAASVIAAGAVVAFIALIPRRPSHVEPVRVAVAPGESLVLDPPLASRGIDVVVSGANISGLAEGAGVGSLQVVDDDGNAFARPIAVGDLADWGAFRPGDLFRTRNPLPRRPGFAIRGGGRDAWLHGEGRLRVRLGRPIRRMIVAASPQLPADARLQIERMEIAAP